MSAAYQAADEMLTAVEDSLPGVDDFTPAALIGVGRAILALVDEVEQVGELLRERLAAVPEPLPMPVPRKDACVVCSVPFVTGERTASVDGRIVHHRCDPRTEESCVICRLSQQRCSCGTRCGICGIRRGKHLQLEAATTGPTTDHAWTEL